MNYRKSSYTITVCVDEKDKQYMLIHGYTGAIDLVSEQLLVTLNSFSNENEFEPEILQVLIDRGYLTEKTEEEEQEYFKRLATALFRKETLMQKGFTFLVTYHCNFCCPYCYEKDISAEKAVFTKEMVDKAYRAITEISSDERLCAMNITLYGGEPLLKENKEIVFYIVKRGKEYDFTFSAISNGYDLDYYEDLLSPEYIKQIQITIDGISQRHNQRRIHRYGIPTFDKIVNNIGLALNKGVQVCVRVNTDKNNANDLEELQRVFTDLHYMDNALFSVDSALLKSYSDDTKNIYQYFSEKEFIAWHKTHNLKISCQDYGTYRRIYSAIKQAKPLAFRPIFCGAQTSGFVLDPLGNIYTCWEVVNRKEHCIGSYMANDEIVWNTDILDKWRQVHIIHNASCSKCKYALLCGGGCPALNFTEHHCIHMEDIVRYAATKAYLSTK